MSFLKSISRSTGACESDWREVQCVNILPFMVKVACRTDRNLGLLRRDRKSHSTVARERHLSLSRITCTVRERQRVTTRGLSWQKFRLYKRASIDEKVRNVGRECEVWDLVWEILERTEGYSGGVSIGEGFRWYVDGLRTITSVEDGSPPANW